MKHEAEEVVSFSYCSCMRLHEIRDHNSPWTALDVVRVSKRTHEIENQAAEEVVSARTDSSARAGRPRTAIREDRDKISSTSSCAVWITA